MNAIILAGGQSSRFGSDKAFIEIDGVPLIKRQIQFLKDIFKKIIIVTNKPQDYKFEDVELVQDIIKNRGPLAGIYSGLMASDTFYNFFIPCDMPFLNSGLINYMFGLKEGFDAVVPKLKKGYETLFAIYSKNCLEPIYKILNTDNLRIVNFFAQVKLREVSEEEVLVFGDPDILFMNINTKDDLCRISTNPKK